MYTDSINNGNYIYIYIRYFVELQVFAANILGPQLNYNPAPQRMRIYMVLVRTITIYIYIRIPALAKIDAGI